MKTLKNILFFVLIIPIIIIALYFFIKNGFLMNEIQLKALKILFFVMLASCSYCFIVGEISRNFSQMDKLWSLMPIVYIWIIASIGGFSIRLIIMGLLVTFWGIRLTINFGLKGAYKLKFWAGEEDYRWKLLRQKKPLSNKVVWFFFDLLFISFYQNFLVFLTVVPGVYAITDKAINLIDIIAICLMLGFILLEMLSDINQYKFHSKKKELLASGKALDEIDSPYNLGFNTTGIWNHMRHPNYLGEQGTWVSFYLFSVATAPNWFNPTIIGPLLLILLFFASSNLQEKISKTKYPLYDDYCNKVFKYLPIHKYRY